MDNKEDIVSLIVGMAISVMSISLLAILIAIDI